MKKTAGFSLLALVLLGSLVVALTPTQSASAIAPLGFSWYCSAYTGQCTFSRTTSNHASYKYNFGDGTFSSCTTSGNASHTYSVGYGENYFTVYFIGYATSGCSSSPDNIVGCTITVEKTTVGGHPGTAGSCS